MTAAALLCTAAAERALRALARRDHTWAVEHGAQAIDHRKQYGAARAVRTLRRCERAEADAAELRELLDEPFPTVAPPLAPERC